MGEAAVVLHSGGQDSTTALYWAKQRFNRIYTVSFDYGQRHAREIEAAGKIQQRVGVDESIILPIPALSILGDAALTSSEIEVEGRASRTSGNVHAAKHGLPSTFVPGRNMLFFTFAAAYGAGKGVYDLVTGICQQDHAGYPDCREVFRHSAERSLTLALLERVQIHVPLMFKTKAETFEMARKLECLDVILEDTVTCYHGVINKNDWGHGCGECPACIERAKGWEEYQTYLVTR